MKKVIDTSVAGTLQFILFCAFMWSVQTHSQEFSSEKKVPSCLNLMPCPKTLTLTNGLVKLSARPTIYVEGMSQQRQKNALARMKSQLSSFDKANLSDFTVIKKKEEADIVITVVKPTDSEPQEVLPQLGDDESYQLTISKKLSNKVENKEESKDDQNSAHIRINANTDFGALHGLTTLTQLITTTEVAKPLQLPTLTIEDTPRFSWRGLLIDSVRHFIPLTTLKRQLDGMAAAKLNVFHWHLTDDQGWRYESKRYPKLHQQASDNLFYTQNEIKDLVHYASLLGIRVLPEFDVPGHASAIAVAYPELITENKSYEMERHWGVFEPLLDISNPKVYQFIDEMVEELTLLFPDSYLHIGGDEVHPKQWLESEKIKQLMVEEFLDDSQDIQRYFNSKIQKILAKHQRQMMGWDEILHPELPGNIMVQSWRGLDSLNTIAASGYHGLLSTGYYIDQPQYTSFHYLNDPQGNAPKSRSIQQSHTEKHDGMVYPKESVDWTNWAFTIPRLKGSAVKGLLTLEQSIIKDKTPLTGYLKLNNNHYTKITIETDSIDLSRLAENNVEIPLIFTIDSWMGPLRFELHLVNDNIKGQTFIGNAPYPVEGEMASQPNFIKLLPQLKPLQEKNILGGEATLWTEMVDQENIDLRSWPRLFAIAERFWSVKSLTDIDNMYQRLQVIDNYAANVIGLKHQVQQRDGFLDLMSVEPTTILVQGSEKALALKALFTVSQAYEPAHYYTRHHLKFQQDEYHQQAKLNYFVDYLPVESFGLMIMKKQLNAFVDGDKSAILHITKRLISWQDAAININEYMTKQGYSVQRENLVWLMKNLIDFTEVSLQVTAQCTVQVLNKKVSKKRLTPSEREKIHQQLVQMESTSQEQVLAGIAIFTRLLSHCSAE